MSGRLKGGNRRWRRGSDPSPLAGEGWGEGDGGMKRNLCHELLMPQGSHFSCSAKKSNQKKAAPTFALIRNFNRKRGAVRNSLALKQRTASSTFSIEIAGVNTRGPRRTDN